MDILQNSLEKIGSTVGLLSPKETVKTHNKYVMITGCDSGLGFETAKRLDQMGFHVIAACLFPDREGAKKLAQATSSNLTIIGLDVTSEESCKSALVEVENLVKDKATGLHALINNAGMTVYADFEWQKMEHCESVINVNLLGSIRVTKHFLRVISRKTGRIINVTSILAYNNTIGLSIYGATKAGLESFSNTLRIELYEKGIQVCTIAPGLMTGATGLMANSAKSVDEMWAAMPESQKQENRKKYEELKEISRKAVRESSAANSIFEWSVSNIMECVSLAKPKTVYVPCFIKMRVIMALMRYIPTSWAIYLVGSLRSRRDDK